MGRKRTRKGEHLLFYTVCVIIAIFSFGGCSLRKKLIYNHPAASEQLRLHEARSLMVKGDFDGALERTREILKSCPQSKDQVFFEMGLIYAHPKNPDNDHDAASRHFEAVMSEFPDSNLRSEAELWSLFLEKLKKKENTIQKQNQEIVTLKQKVDSLLKEKAARVKEISELQEHIEQLKEIDLSIEEKKRKSLP